MKTIAESPYFFSVNSKNLPNKDKNIFYGLLNMKQNRFYMLGRDYSLTKLIQFLFLKYELFCVVSFKNFNFDAHKEIDNQDCFKWGGSPQMHKGLQYDIDVNKPNILLMSSESPIENFDYDLQEKMFFFMDLLTKIKTQIDIFKTEETERINEIIKGLEEFKKFSMIMSPDDKNISNFINNEIESKKVNLIFLDNFWKELIQCLYNFDLKNNNISKILEQATNFIQNTFYKTRHANTIKTLKNEIYKAFNVKI